MTLWRRPLLALLLASGCSIPLVCAAQSTPTAARKAPNESALVYQVLVAEMSVTQGDLATAYQLLIDAARKSEDARLFERSIQIALRSRSGDSALQAAQAWSRIQPQSREANRYVLQLLLGLNRPAEALEPLRRDLAGTPVAERSAAITQIPRLFNRVSDRALAAQVVEQALAAETGDPGLGPAAWLAIGSMRMSANQRNAAVLAAQKGFALNPKAREPMLLALGLMDSDNPDAEALVRKHLSSETPPELRLNFASRLVDLRQTDAALEQLRSLTTQAPDFAPAWLLRGSLAMQTRDHALAQVALQRYVSLVDQGAPSPSGTNDPSDRGRNQAFLLLAQLAEQSRRLDEATAYLDRIPAEAVDLRVLSRRASILARSGKLEQGRELIRNAPERQGEDARAKFSAELQLLRDARQHATVYQMLSKAVKEQPDDIDLLYDLAMASEKIDRLDEMEQLLRRVIALKPDYHHAYNALGYSFADRKLRLEEARSLIAKALEFAPDDPFIIDSMAWVEYRRGNLEEAQRLLQQAFSQRPDAEIAAHLGEVLWMRNQRDQARRIWNEGLALNPDNETLQDTLKRFGKP